MHILWINAGADFIGGCERYVFETAALLAERQGVRSTLLYDVDEAAQPNFDYVAGFNGGAFPLVDAARQIAEIAPDVVYIHRVSDRQTLKSVAECPVPTVRFFHDHKLFCPREHKYTVRNRMTCTRTIGAGCFVCGGIVNRTPVGGGKSRGLHITLPSALRAAQVENIALLDAFVVGSNYMAHHLTAHGFPRARVHTLPLYTRLPLFEPIALASERDPNLLVFAGTLTTGKGVDILLNALALCKTPARLLLLGTGHFEAEYRAQAHRLGLDDRITWGGHATPDEMAQAFRQCGAMVFPSRSPETFGLVGPEAMRHGTPVIAARVGGIGEWLHEEISGLAVPPCDPAALAAAIDRLAGDDALRDRLGRNAHTLCRERFSPERHIDRLMTLFETLVRVSHHPLPTLCGLTQSYNQHEREAATV